jgi:predicted NBD/HSP70 family sugar kinase
MPDAPWFLGIDVGGSWVRLLGEDADGRRGQVVTRPTPDSYDSFLALLQALAAEVVDGPLAAACCGLPGTSHGERALFVPALSWMEGRRIGADLAQAVGAPVTLGLDGHLTLLGEVAEGAAAGCRSALLVALGTGIGGAVMIGGRIWRGHHGSAGSWGWLPAAGGVDDPDHGPFEQVASGQALTSRARRLRSGWSGEALVEAARTGDAKAIDEVQGYAEVLGRGLAALASIFDPELLLVGGGLSDAMDLLGPIVDKRLRAAGSPDGRRVPIRAAALGAKAGVVGALRAARRGESVWL